MNSIAQHTHPGTYFKEHAVPDGKFAAEVAKELDLSRPARSNVLNGKTSISQSIGKWRTFVRKVPVKLNKFNKLPQNKIVRLAGTSMDTPQLFDTLMIFSGNCIALHYKIHNISETSTRYRRTLTMSSKKKPKHLGKVMKNEQYREQLRGRSHNQLVIFQHTSLSTRDIEEMQK